MELKKTLLALMVASQQWKPCTSPKTTDRTDALIHVLGQSINCSEHWKPQGSLQMHTNRGT